MGAVRRNRAVLRTCDVQLRERAVAQSRSPSAVDGRMVMRRVGAQFRNDGGACTIEVEMLMYTAVRATGPTQRVEDYHQ